MIAVSRAPTITPSMGFLKSVRRDSKDSESLRGAMELPMVSIPIISRANQTRMPPMSFFLPFFVAIRMTTPISASTGAKFSGLHS